MADWGYISAFDGLTIVNGSTTKHTSLVGDTTEIIDRLQTLANGTKINYDGTGDASVRPGRVDQFVRAASSSTAAITALDAITAKKQMRGVLTKTLIATAVTQTCIGILTDITVLNSVPMKDYYNYGLHFNLEDDWH